MFEGHQLIFSGQSFQWSAFKDRLVAIDIIQYLRLKYAETTVDPAFANLGFFVEKRNLVTVKCDTAKTRGWSNCCDGGQLAVSLVEGDQGVDIHIRHTVSIGHHEGLVIDPPRKSFDASAGHCVQARISQMNVPVLDLAVLDVVLRVAEMDGKVAVVLVIINEIRLNDLGFVTHRHGKISMAEVGVELHDVPNDRFAANLDHRFWSNRGLFLQTWSQSSGKDDYLHGVSSFKKFLGLKL